MLVIFKIIKKKIIITLNNQKIWWFIDCEELLWKGASLDLTFYI